VRDPIEQALLTQATALRALARDLVGEQHADDLVQDAAVEALRAPPRRGGPLGGWLATIVRHLASKHRRGERRRLARELAAARPEQAPAERSSEQVDAFARLTRAVLALPEPYRTTVLLRYLRDRAPRAIAAEQRVPVRTVKTRLQRGLALLRDALGRERSDWRALLTSACGLERVLPTAAAVTTGVLLMGSATKLVVSGIAVAAALALAWWIGPGQQRSAIPSRGAAADGAVVPAIAAANSSPADATAAQRMAVTAPSPDPDSTPVVVRGRCVDEQGRALAGVTAKWSLHRAGEIPVPRPDAPIAATTAAEGLFELRLAAPGGTNLHVELASNGRATLEGVVENMATRTPLDLGELVLLPLVEVRGIVVDTRGRPQGDVTVELQSPSDPDAIMHAVHSSWMVTSGPDGRFGPVLLPRRGTGCGQVDHRRLASGTAFKIPLEGTAVQQLEIVVVSDEDAPPIRGTVTDDAGRPVAQATVALDGATARTASRADGTFVLRPGSLTDGSGPFTIEVRRDGFAVAQSSPHRLGDADVRIVLQRLPELRVHVRAADTHAPIEDFTVALLDYNIHREHRRWPGGTAALSTRQRGKAAVFVDPGPGDYATSALVPVEFGDAPQELTIELDHRAERTLRLRTATGDAVRAHVELLEPDGQPIRLDTEAFALEQRVILNGRKLPVLQEGESHADGALQLRGPGGRALALRLRGRDCAAQVVQPVRLDESGVLEITVQSGGSWVGGLVPADVGRSLFAASQPATNKAPEVRAFGIDLWRIVDGGEETLHRHLEGPFAYDAEGRFAIEHIPAGTWRVALHALNFTRECEPITVREGEMLEHDLDVEAMRLADVDLQFLIDGASAGEIPVIMIAEHAVDASGVPFTSRQTMQADRNGQVRCRTFAGTLFPQLGVRGGWLHAPPLVVAAGVVRQVLSLQRAQFELQLSTPDGAPAAKVPVRFGGDGAFETETDAAGRARADGLAAGRYPLRVRQCSLCDDAGRTAYEQQFGSTATHNAWLALPDLDLRAGDNGVLAVRLPREWDR
jgi:RNA polymerase sigma-70 factor (ECF subfamily)